MKTNTFLSQSTMLIRYVQRTLLVCLFFWIAGSVSPAAAQVYSTVNGYAQQEVTTPQYQSYQSNVYEPFSSSTPRYIGSRRQEAPGTTGGTNPTNPTIPSTTINNGGGLQGGGDPYPGELQSPVGESWVLLFFAAVAALTIFVRRKKASTDV
jgi:hypothetical protein